MLGMGALSESSMSDVPDDGRKGQRQKFLERYSTTLPLDEMNKCIVTAKDTLLNWDFAVDVNMFGTFMGKDNMASLIELGFIDQRHKEFRKVATPRKPISIEYQYYVETQFPIPNRESILNDLVRIKVASGPPINPNTITGIVTKYDKRYNIAMACKEGLIEPQDDGGFYISC